MMRVSTFMLRRCMLTISPAEILARVQGMRKPTEKEVMWLGLCHLYLLIVHLVNRVSSTRPARVGKVHSGSEDETRSLIGRDP